MKVTLKSAYRLLFLLGIFFIPFNSYEGVKELGEFKKESAAIFFLLGFVLLSFDILKDKKLALPYKNKLFLYLVFFLIWCILCTILNFPDILDNYFKRTSGISRFVRQYFAIMLSCILFFMLYWYIIYKESLRGILSIVRKAFFFSFVFVSFYGLLEIAYNFFGISPAYYVLRLFDYFPFTEYDADINGRISSVTWEPPALATYLITVAGWMFSYIITGKNWKKYIPTILVIVLTYYSGSRTALVVVFVQLLVFLMVVLTRIQKIKFFIYSSTVIASLTLLVVVSNGDKIIRNVTQKIESLDFTGNLKTNISNKSRFGIQYANMKVFAANPIVGVGFGQQGFHSRNLYPRWATINNWEFEEIYSNKTNPMFAPGYNIYVRLLAETGIIGFSIFIVLIVNMIKGARGLIKEGSQENYIVGLIVLISVVGFSLNWLQMDTFRLYGFWLCLAILIKFQQTSSISSTNS